MSGNLSRNKGAVGEREAAAIIEAELGFKVRRRIRADGGDGDLVGVPNWSIEVKRAKKPNMGPWWDQAVRQAKESGKIPVLLYRVDWGCWRAVWPLCCAVHGEWGYDIAWTCESSIEAWAAVARENME